MSAGEVSLAFDLHERGLGETHSAQGVHIQRLFLEARVEVRVGIDLELGLAGVAQVARAARIVRVARVARVAGIARVARVARVVRTSLLPLVAREWLRYQAVKMMSARA